jgi:predicted transcriptional regulator of viral defense system
MNTKLVATMASHGGLLSHAEALDCGLSANTIRQLIRSGRLVVLRRGMYADGELWAELDEHRGRHRLRTRAATRQMVRGFVISHDSAAYEHGLQIVEPPKPLVHITRPGFTGAWTKAGVKHHLAGFQPEQVLVADDLEMLGNTESPTERSRATRRCGAACPDSSSTTHARR